MRSCERCGYHDAYECIELSQFVCWGCFNEADAPSSPTPSASPSSRCVPSSLSLSLSHQGQEQAEDDGEKYGDALLADVAAGAIDVVAVELPNVPDDASEIVRRVVEDFAMVAGARLAVGDVRAVPYACRWAAARLSVSHMTVNRVLTSLVEWGALCDEGAMPGRGGRGTRLYSPAAVTEAVVLEFRSRWAA
jgi:hypothetical protein